MRNKSLFLFISVFCLSLFSAFSLAAPNYQTIKGTKKADKLVSKNKKPVSFKGLAGNDVLRSIYAKRSVYNDGPGNDRMFLGQKNSNNSKAEILNGAGSDTIYGQKIKKLFVADGPGNDTVYFPNKGSLEYLDDKGNDKVVASQTELEDNAIIFQKGNNSFVGSGAAILDGRDNDTYQFLPNSDASQEVDNFINLIGGENLVNIKGEQDMVIQHSSGDNIIHANKANVTWTGGADEDSNNSFYGGSGIHEILMNNAESLLYQGGNNHDIIYGGNTDKVNIETFAGEDIIRFDLNLSNHTDFISSGAGDDKLNLAVGKAVVDLGIGEDTLALSGGESTDYIVDTRDGEIDTVTCNTSQDETYSNLVLLSDPEDVTESCSNSDLRIGN